MTSWGGCGPFVIPSMSRRLSTPVNRTWCRSSSTERMPGRIIPTTGSISSRRCIRVSMIRSGSPPPRPPTTWSGSRIRRRSATSGRVPGSSPTSPPGSGKKRSPPPGTTSFRSVRIWPPRRTTRGTTTPTRRCCWRKGRIGSGGTDPIKSPATTVTSTGPTVTCWAPSTTPSASTGLRS